MAFLRRSTGLLRSTLTRICLNEQPQQQQLGVFRHAFYQAPLGVRSFCSMPSTKLFVGGLPWALDDNSLREAFVEYGEVVEAKVVLDRETGRSKGFGFVSFTCTQDAESAKNAMDGTNFNGRPLRVNFAIEKQRGFGSFGGGGSSFGSNDGGSSQTSFSSNNFASSPQSFSQSDFGAGSSNNFDNTEKKNYFDDAFGDLGGSDEKLADGSR